MRIGRSIALAIEVDGRFAGQCSLGAIDPAAATGELGIWADSEVARQGVTSTTIAMMLDFAFSQLGLRRITAPICVDNFPATNAAAQGGLVPEAVMAEYLDAGGSRKDHTLWTVLGDEAPPEGFTQQWIARVEAKGRKTSPGPQLAAAQNRRGFRAPAFKALAAACGYHLGNVKSLRTAWSLPRSLELRSPGDPAACIRSPKPADWPVARDFDEAPLGQIAWSRYCVRARRALRGPSEVILMVEINGVLAGRCAIHRIDTFTSNGELSLCMTGTQSTVCVKRAVIRLALEHAFRNVRLKRVSALCDPRDAGSAAVLESAGLVREGTLRRHVGAGGRRADYDLWAVTASRYAQGFWRGGGDEGQRDGNCARRDFQ